MPDVLYVSTSPAVSENPNHQRRWLVLCIVAFAQLMVVLDGDRRPLRFDATTELGHLTRAGKIVRHYRSS